MIEDTAALSPPPTPVDLTMTGNLVASTPALTTCTVTSARTPTSPQVSFDGITFTANVADFFSVSPTSPPESDFDSNEVSLFDDDEIDAKVKDVCGSSRSSSGSLSSDDGFINADLAEAAIKAVQAAPALATAVTSVLQTGSMTPLIKEELKYTIQTKRLRDGKSELAVVKEKKKKSQLTPEEEERRRRRRERNKVAAQKCRDKKSEQARILTEEIEMLEGANGGLRSELKSLSKEIEQLRNMMVRHDKSTQCSQSILPTAGVDTSEVVMPPTKKQKVSRGARAKNN